MQQVNNITLTPRQKKAYDLLTMAEESGFDIVVRDQITKEEFRRIINQIDYQPLKTNVQLEPKAQPVPKSGYRTGYRTGDPKLARGVRRLYALPYLEKYFKQKINCMVQIPFGPYTGDELQQVVSSWLSSDSKANNYVAHTSINRKESTLDVTLEFYNIKSPQMQHSLELD